jgi:hypothetical protein
MKKIFILNLILIIGWVTINIISCKKKDTTPVVKGCIDKNSLNYNANATQDDGSCTYASDAFIGVYNVQDTVYDPYTHLFYYATYLLTIQKGTASSTLNIYNINNIGSTNTAQSGSSSKVLQLPNQIYHQTVVTISGTFYLNVDTLTFALTTIGGDNITITGKGIK